MSMTLMMTHWVMKVMEYFEFGNSNLCGLFFNIVTCILTFKKGNESGRDYRENSFDKLILNNMLLYPILISYLLCHLNKY